MHVGAAAASVEEAVLFRVFFRIEFDEKGDGAFAFADHLYCYMVVIQLVL